MSFPRSLCGLVVTVAMLLFAGCGSGGPDLSPVSGTVTLNGEPLEGAKLLFQSVGGRPAGAMTDAAGHYELIFTGDRKGARAGEYVVTITTYRSADPDLKREMLPERVPPEYNVKTTLKATIDPDKSNVVDFPLVNDSRVPQPRPDL